MPSHKFSYVTALQDRVLPDAMPYLPLTLEINGITRDASGLVDSGSTVNVLPYGVGLELGAV